VCKGLFTGKMIQNDIFYEVRFTPNATAVDDAIKKFIEQQSKKGKLRYLQIEEVKEKLRNRNIGRNYNSYLMIVLIAAVVVAKTESTGSIFNDFIEGISSMIFLASILIHFMHKSTLYESALLKSSIVNL
jgi:hypothetical protein